MAKKKPAKVRASEKGWEPPPFRLYERAWRIEDYFSAEIGDVLESAYLAMADAFEAANVRLRPSIYREILPEQAFKLVVHLGAFPGAEDDVRIIGGRHLTPEYKDELLRSLAGAIEYVAKTASGQSVKWREPTPPETIDLFLKKAKWYKTDLIKKVSGIDDYVCETTKQFFKRLYREPKTTGQFGIDPRTREKLKRVRDVMVIGDN